MMPIGQFLQTLTIQITHVKKNNEYQILPIGPFRVGLIYGTNTGTVFTYKHIGASFDSCFPDSACSADTLWPSHDLARDVYLSSPVVWMEDISTYISYPILARRDAALPLLSPIPMRGGDNNQNVNQNQVLQRGLNQLRFGQDDGGKWDRMLHWAFPSPRNERTLKRTHPALL